MYLIRKLINRSVVTALAALACAAVAATAAPVASANSGSCGGYSITTTGQTNFSNDSNNPEKVVIDVWGSSAPHPSSVVIGGTQWTLKSSTAYSDHNSSTWVHVSLARGSWSFSLTENGQFCGMGMFSIV